MLNYQLMRQQHHQPIQNQFKSLISDNFSFSNNNNLDNHVSMPSVANIHTSIKTTNNSETNLDHQARIMSTNYYFNNSLSHSSDYSSKPVTSTPTNSYASNTFSYMNNATSSTHQSSPFYLPVADQASFSSTLAPATYTFNAKDNRFFVPLYCGICRAYGCQCFYGSSSASNGGGPPSTTSTPGMPTTTFSKTISGNELSNTNNPIGASRNGLKNNANSLLIYSQHNSPSNKSTNENSVNNNVNRNLLTTLPNSHSNSHLLPIQFGLSFEGANSSSFDKHHHHQYESQSHQQQQQQQAPAFFNYMNNPNHPSFVSTTPPTLSTNTSSTNLMTHLNNRTYTAISSPPTTTILSILPSNASQPLTSLPPPPPPPPPYLFYQQTSNQLVNNNNSVTSLANDKRLDQLNTYFQPIGMNNGHSNNSNGIKQKLVHNNNSNSYHLVNGLYNNNTNTTNNISISKPTHFSPIKSITTSSSSSSSLNNSNGTSFFSNPGLTTPLYLSNTSSSLSSSMSPPTSSSTSSFFTQQYYNNINSNDKQAYVAVNNNINSNNNGYINNLKLHNKVSQGSVLPLPPPPPPPPPAQLQFNQQKYYDSHNSYDSSSSHQLQSTPIVTQRPNLKPQQHQISPNNNANYLKKYYNSNQSKFNNNSNNSNNKNGFNKHQSTQQYSQSQSQQQIQQQQPVIANKVRNKKFAAYESLLYKSTDSSSSSLSSTPLCFSPIPNNQQLDDQFNRYTTAKKRTPSAHPFAQPQVQQQQQYNQTNRFLTLCRHGQNCRFKRENKCKYYHPNVNDTLVPTPNGFSYNHNCTHTHNHNHHNKYRSASAELKNIDISDYSIDSIEDNNINELIDQSQSKLDESETITNVTSESSTSSNLPNINNEVESNFVKHNNLIREKIIKNEDDEIKLNWLTENMSIKLNYKKIEVNSSDAGNMLNFDDENFDDDDDDDEDDEESIELLLGTTNGDPITKLSEIEFEKRKNRLLNSSHSSLSSSLSSSSLASSKTITYEAFDIISSANSTAMVSTKLERTVLAE